MVGVADYPIEHYAALFYFYIYYQMITKTLIKHISQETWQPVRVVKQVMDTMINSIKSLVTSWVSITFFRFGKFQSTDTPQRNWVNPKTWDPIIIPAKKRITFKVSQSFKDLANN